MLRILLSTEDFARVRFEADPGPLVDVGLAARALRQRPLATLAHWRAAVAPAVDSRIYPLLALTPPTGTTCTFVQPLCPDLDAGLDLIESLSPAQMRPEIADLRVRPTGWLRDLADGDRRARADLARATTRMYTVGIAPVTAHLAADREADVARRTVDLAAHGLHAVVPALHRSVRLTAQGLEIDRPFAFTHRSPGLGLILVPSPFLVDEVRVAINEDQPVTLFYPTGTPVPSRAGGDAQDPLARMLGSTRAAVLRALGTGCGTVTLSRRIDSSPATASEHVAVLRDAGLVATARAGRGVRHWLTPLGARVLARGTPHPLHTSASVRNADDEGRSGVPPSCTEPGSVTPPAVTRA